LRVCLDTNIIISGLASPNHVPARLLQLWLDGRFTLVTSEWQLAEFRRVSRYPRIRARVPARLAGHFVNTARLIAVVLENLEPISSSPDPDDGDGGYRTCLSASESWTSANHDGSSLTRHSRDTSVTAKQINRKSLVNVNQKIISASNSLKPKH
jgi:hypothetical protein